MTVLRRPAGRPAGVWGAICAVLLSFAFAGNAAAATITVNTEADQVVSDGRCALREAITAANTDNPSGGCAAGSGNDTIKFSVAHPKLSRTGAHENANSTGDLDVLSNVTVSGNGA